MSFPIVACEVSKAARGDEAAYARLLEKMKFNFACGHWSSFPCSCEPRCPSPSDAELKALDKRLVKDINNGVKPRRRRRESHQGNGQAADRS